MERITVQKSRNRDDAAAVRPPQRSENGVSGDGARRRANVYNGDTRTFLEQDLFQIGLGVGRRCRTLWSRGQLFRATWYLQGPTRR